MAVMLTEEEENQRSHSMKLCGLAWDDVRPRTPTELSADVVLLRARWAKKDVLRKVPNRDKVWNITNDRFMLPSNSFPRLVAEGRARVRAFHESGFKGPFPKAVTYGLVNGATGEVPANAFRDREDESDLLVGGEADASVDDD
jgi:hypothetical protein